MRPIEEYISPLVQGQFPSFYKEEGPLFLLFAEEYYKWLETRTYTNNGAVKDGGYVMAYARNLLDNRDIDKTLDEFLVYFYQKYLKNIQFVTQTNKKFLLKAAQDLYRSKGSERSLDLIFRLLYGETVQVYLPSRDIFKASSGKWYLPKYLEVTRSSRTPFLLNKEITGSKSGAKAFIEQIITRVVNGRLIDVLYMSNVRGDFQYGDIITDNGLVADAPRVTGSLTSMNVTTGGREFEEGEIVDIVSDFGVRGKARVTGIQSTTGVVDFAITDIYSSTRSTYRLSPPGFQPSTTNVYSYGTSTTVAFYNVSLITPLSIFSGIQRWAISSGSYNTPVVTPGGGSGYSNTAQVIVSDKVMQISKINASTNTFLKFEKVTQNLTSAQVHTVIGPFPNTGRLYTANLSGNSMVFSTTGSTGNTANIIFNTTSGDMLANTYLYFPEIHYVDVNVSTSNTFVVGQGIVQSNGSSNVTSGIIESISDTVVIELDTGSIAGGFAPGQFVRQGSTANGYIVGVPWKSNFNQSNVSYVVLANVQGTFSNTSGISAFANVANVTFYLGNATPTFITSTKRLRVANTSGNSFNESNTIISTSGFVSGTIKASSNVGGYINSYSSVTASGNVMGSNAHTSWSSGLYGFGTGHIGLVDISNTFYYGVGSRLKGTESNIEVEITNIYGGQSANVQIGFIDNAETVTVTSDRLAGNNDGLGTLTVPYMNIKLTGANATFGTILDVLVANGGTGYTNGYTSTSGGSPTAVANLEIITNNSGTIQVIVPIDTGEGYSSDPTITLSGGSGANVIALFPYGFAGNQTGHLKTILNEILDSRTLSIGSIATLTNINPGENYNIDPFVYPYEPLVASYNKQDVYIEYDNTTALFRQGETLIQTTNKTRYSLTTNTLPITANGGNYYGNNQLNVVTISNGGWGYTNGTVLSTSHQILSAVIGSPMGYANAHYYYTTITSSIAKANVAIVTNGNGTITSLTYNNSGVGIVNAASVVIKGNSTDTNKIRAVGIENGGTNYTNNELVVFSGTGSGANAYITTNANGTITAVTISANGSGYTAVPTYTVSRILSSNVVINDGGTGYTNGDILAFSGGGGINANGTVSTAANGTITSVTLSNTGNYYTSTPTVSVTGSGSGANLAVSMVGVGQSLTVYIDAVFTSNTKPSLPLPGEYVYSLTNTAIYGVVNTSSYDSGANSYTILIDPLNGVFTNGAYRTVTSKHLANGSTTNISLTASVRGYVKSATPIPISSLNPRGWVLVRRTSLFNDFVPGKDIIGSITGTTANAQSVTVEAGSLPMGENAFIDAKVISANGAVTNVEIIDSGLGYVQDETVSFTNRQGFSATAKTNILNQGTGEGRYLSTDGFLSDTKKLFDGDYYQEYSYEVQSAIPIETYRDVLREVLHVAGTQYFGGVLKTSVEAIDITVENASNSSITVS